MSVHPEYVYLGCIMASEISGVRNVSIHVRRHRRIHLKSDIGEHILPIPCIGRISQRPLIISAPSQLRLVNVDAPTSEVLGHRGAGACRPFYELRPAALPGLQCVSSLSCLKLC